MTTYRSSKPVCSAHGETTEHSRKELLKSPHREVRAGAMTGRSFVFGGVVFTPQRASERTQPGIAERYAIVMTDEFARSCDLGARPLPARRVPPKSASWQYAAAVVIILAIARALGLGVRVADTVAHDSWDPRKETRQ